MRHASMVRNLLVMLTGVFCCAAAHAAKPAKPGGGGSDPTVPYRLVDLLGFDNGGLGLQSRAYFITHRFDSGGSLIYGDSYLRSSGAPSELRPAHWGIDVNGEFPASDPVNRGLPDFAREVEPTGFNSFGIGVGWTRRAVEQDDQGNWVFPGCVDFFGTWLELPAGATRYSAPNAINDAGVIVGWYQDIATGPGDPDGYWYPGGMWQLLPDGTIDGPISLGDFRPTDINNHGVMAGNSLGYLAIAWFDANGHLNVMALSSSNRYLGSNVNAINDYPIGDARLTVVGGSWLNEAGEYNVADSQRAYAWRPFDAANATTLLGTLGGNRSEARDVNDLGQIVGWSDTKRDGERAFLYTDGSMSNLNNLVDAGKAWLNRAYGINNDGDIVGIMQVPRPVSEEHGFLLRPIAP